jgi:hypothetical protein
MSRLTTVAMNRYPCVTYQWVATCRQSSSAFARFRDLAGRRQGRDQVERMASVDSSMNGPGGEARKKDRTVMRRCSCSS